MQTTKVKPAGKRGRPATGQVPQRQIRATDQEWANWQTAATAAGLTRSAFMRLILNRAAARRRAT